MPRALTETELAEIRDRYSDQLNFGANDTFSPIDPLTYVQPEGDTVIHVAAMRGDERTISLLLEAGADPNSVGDMGSTPLHYAYTRKHDGVVKLLLDHGASTTTRDEFGKMPGEK